MKLKTVFVLLAIMSVAGCNEKSTDLANKGGETEVTIDSRILSDLILLQYAREINTWTANSPKK